ncbi:MAG: S8 family serine peptidase [Planctomycetota bacterium]
MPRLTRELYRARFWALALLVTAWLCAAAQAAADRRVGPPDMGDRAVRRRIVERLAQASRHRKAVAWDIARGHGWTPIVQTKWATLELMAVQGDRVYCYRTCNVNAAISIAADLIRNTIPYDANGHDLIVGIWDAGAVRPTHQELAGRVNVMENIDNHYHSTHVGGTVAAAGVRPDALGMAPSVLIDSYDWNDDLAQMTSRAMSYPNEPDTIQLSNHSYGYAAGWEHSTSPPHWYGTWGHRESDYFGLYDSETAQWDELCYNVAYYLPFKSAGNDRSDQAPADGEVFEYYKFPRWRRKVYDSSSDPCDDGWDNGGFDTISPISCAKNIMTVGAVHDGVSGSVRDPERATMATFSVWGPTDDGRIKPDIVANGIGLYSATASSDSSYESYSGTSMSAPSAAGAAALLVDYYDRLFPGQAMRAGTLKALIIHTADDLGKPGPDYKFGWGLINTEAAAEQIRDCWRFPDANVIVEGVLDDANTLKSYTFGWDGCGGVRATVCWTDPPATGGNDLDDPTPRLVNDLDLRILDPNGFVYYPYVLDPANPNTPAATADNVLDNVEQVAIASPNIPGDYIVQVSYKGVLANNQQHFSLIVSGNDVGQRPADLNDDGLVDLKDVAILVDYWLQNKLSADIAPDCGDMVIDFLDFAELARDFE